MPETTELIQGSIEWLCARAGKVTASRIADVMDRTKKGEDSAKRSAYKWQMVVETLTGRPADAVFVNDAMKWGTETEPFARAQYEQERELVDLVGMVAHPTIERGAASPDGLVGADGLLEIKCPNSATHLGYVRDGAVPDKYKPQMAWQMACTGRQWCDFMSYDPRLPEGYDRLVVRYHRDEAFIATIEAEVVQFLSEVDALLAELKDRF
jgi:putative phage-type endonuclease